jgi:hypothetical protein
MAPRDKNNRGQNEGIDNLLDLLFEHRRHLETPAAWPSAWPATNSIFSANWSWTWLKK